MSALIQIVDDRDQPVRAGTKQEAWADGLWHRVVRIMLDDGRGNLLLQHRSSTKNIYPDCWDNSAAGHVDAGEDYESAAYRELQEELGLANVPLRETGAYVDEHVHRGNHYKRFVRVYTATIEGTPKGQEPGNIDDVRWFSVAEVKQLVADHPDEVSDGLAQVITTYY